MENSNQGFKINTSAFKKTFSKKNLMVLGIIILLLFVACFTNYQKMPGRAKGELGTYLAKNLPGYTSIQDLYYTIHINSKGYKVTIGGNVKNNYKKSVTLYSEIQFNHLMLNPKIKTTKINDISLTKEKLKDYKYVSNLWWN